MPVEQPNSSNNDSARTEAEARAKHSRTFPIERHHFSLC